MPSAFRHRDALAPRWLLFALALPVALLLASPVQATPPLPDRWRGDFAIPAFSGRTSACAIYAGHYVVAGQFEWAAGTQAENVAAWNGTDWLPLGAGLRSPVRRLAPRGSRLLAGGDSYFGESPVMQFDGADWRPLGPELQGEVDALLVDGLNVFAAGRLLVEGLAGADRVMKWNGSSWQPVGGAFDGKIQALAMFDGRLHAGGDFTDADGTPAARIAQWDGTAWSSLGTSAADGAVVNAFAVYGGRLIAGGIFQSMAGVAAQGIAAWNGSAWEALPDPPQDVWVRDLQVEGSLLYIAGVLQIPGAWASGIVAFDGLHWNPPAPYPTWSIDDVAVGGGMLIAVGDFSGLYDGPGTPRKPARNVVVRDPTWHDLTAWKPGMRGLLGPSNTAVQALHQHRGELYAGGYFEYAADPPSWRETGGLARWDGGYWRPLVQPLRGWVYVLGSWGERLIAAGSPMSTMDNRLCSAVLAWDGESWSDLGQSLMGWVSCVTEWQGELVAGGSIGVVGDLQGVVVHRGRSWEPLGTGLLGASSTVADVAVFDNELYAAGLNLQVAGGSLQPLVRWDGSAWTSVPGTPSGSVRCLMPRGQELWVGFESYWPGGGVARWDGLQWTSVGDLRGTIAKLVTLGDDVYACGSFDSDTRHTTLARWNGAVWEPIRDAPNLQVNAMAGFQGELFLGGWFTEAGRRQAEGIALWSPVGATPITGVPSLERVWPTPARDRVAFRFTLQSEGRVQVLLHDLRGAIVARPIDEELPTGTYDRTWFLGSARDRLRPGVYFAHLVTPAGGSSIKVVIAP